MADSNTNKKSETKFKLVSHHPKILFTVNDYTNWIRETQEHHEKCSNMGYCEQIAVIKNVLYIGFEQKELVGKDIDKELCIAWTPVRDPKDMNCGEMQFTKKDKSFVVSENIKEGDLIDIRLISRPIPPKGAGNYIDKLELAYKNKEKVSAGEVRLKIDARVSLNQKRFSVDRLPAEKEDSPSRKKTKIEQNSQEIQVSQEIEEKSPNMGYIKGKIVKGVGNALEAVITSLGITGAMAIGTWSQNH